MKLLLSAGCLFLPVALFWILAVGALLVILREAGVLLLAGLAGLVVGLAATGLLGADRDIAAVVGWLAFVGIYGNMLRLRLRERRHGSDAG